ncbi:MAG: glycine radical domain-containing protein [Desulfatiglans sp.]|jgi:formate C-acetyltransferase|nr:glycine radical domain-containing protein [Thermodesulfobacteriota bacterium]MEE4354147.1 glycine radical domain-containing protein [Desulfatiglans sp.]
MGAQALPKGKKYRETFADGSISPYPDRDKNGPAAVLKSVGKITPKFPELFNQRFMPQFLEGENKRTFADYVRKWSDLGIYHVQFNCVDDKTLLEAQNEPDKHSDLVVRVAGYSAYFVDLSKGVQDEIVARVGLGF